MELLKHLIRFALCLALSMKIFLVVAGGVAMASPVQTIVEEQVKQLDLREIEAYWEQLLQNYGGFFPEGKTPSFWELMVPGGEGFQIDSLFTGILRYLFHEVLYNGKLLVTIVVITVFSMLLETLQSAFGRQEVSKVAFAISYVVLMIIAVNSFYVAIGYAKEAIESMVHFMIAMIPLLLTLLASMGNVITTSMMHPVIIFMIHVVGTSIHTFVFPLLFFSAVLHLVSGMSDKYSVTHLANLLRNVGLGLLAGMLTIFLGVISVQTATAAASDGITIKAAKFVTGNFIPVVGRMLSDATDTVISASLMVKNAVGISGVVILLMLCAFPAVKILVLALIYNLAGAVLQPLGSSPMVTCLQTIGKSMVFVFAALACVSLMFFLAITIILTAGNISIMMR